MATIANQGFDWSQFAGDRWTPEKVGDEIAGDLMKVREELGKSGVLPVLTLDTADGEREVWAGQVYLQQELAKCAPQIGDHITIQLVELRNTGMPSPMKVFAVEVMRARRPADTDDEPF